MKKIILTTILFSITLSTFSQYFNATKKNLKTTVWDISGEKTTGFFYNSNDSIFVVFDKEKNCYSSFYKSDIYRLKVKRNSFKSTLITLGILEAINIPMAFAWDGMVSPPAAFIIGHAIVLPPTVAVALISNIERYDVILEENPENYDLINNWIKRRYTLLYKLDNSEKFPEFDTVFFKNTVKKERNENALSDINQPFGLFRPDITPIISLNFSTGSTFSPFYKKETAFTNYRQFSVSLRIDDKYRVKYIGEYQYWNDEPVAFNYFHTMMIERNLVSSNRIMESRFDVKVGVGTNLYRSNYWTESSRETVNVLGLKSSILADCFLNKYISINCYSAFNLFPSKEIKVETGTKKLQTTKINMTSFQFGIGFGVHF